MLIRFIALTTFILMFLAIPFSLMAAGDSKMSGDAVVASRLQSVHLPGLDMSVNTLNWFGFAIPLIATTVCLAVILLRIGRRWEAGFLLAAVAAAQIANAGLKFVFTSPRPEGEFIQAGTQFGGYGYPSGHTMSVLVFCSVLVFLLHRLVEQPLVRVLAGVAALFVVGGMGFSRIYVGAHWPSDVLGAYLWGGIILLALIAVYHRLDCKFRAGLD